MKKENFNRKIFKIAKALVRLFYSKRQIIGEFPDEPCIFVGNHSQIHGPIGCELFFPDSCYTWCAGQMMQLKEVPAYTFEDFWSQKPKWQRPFFKAASFVIAPLSVAVFGSARTIAVYKDSRILGTFKNSVSKLNDGKSLVIFPEHDVKFNHILYDFQDKFIDIAKLYNKVSGKNLLFVPIYVAPKLKKIYIGNGIRFDFEDDIDCQRRKIKEYLMNEITNIATTLPIHTVVPYRNIKKKDYPLNKQGENK